MRRYSLVSPPAQPKPAGIRFRIYILAIMFGVVAPSTFRGKTATGILLWQVPVLMLTVYP